MALENRSNREETGKQEVLAACWLQKWLQEEGGSSRSASVLTALAQQTERCLRRGEPPPLAEMEALREAVLDREGGRRSAEASMGKWLPTRQLLTWWDSREARRIEQALAAGLRCTPKLIAHRGGGRSNVNRFSLAFEPIPPTGTTDEADVPDSESRGGVVSYSGQTLKASYFYRWLLPGRPVRLNSWRGYLLLGSLVVSWLVVAGAWYLLIVLLGRPGPLSSSQVAFLLLVIFITASAYVIDRPWLRLPEDRVAIAPEIALPWNQSYGQLQLIRDRDGRRSGWLNLIRYSGNCPTCAGTVELTAGGRAFPDRIIGRCRDSPLEHVYSFDPVSLLGHPLR